MNLIVFVCWFWVLFCFKMFGCVGCVKLCCVSLVVMLVWMSGFWRLVLVCVF